MKQHDTEEQFLQGTRIKANEPIGWKGWALLILFVVMAGVIIYQSRQIKDANREKKIEQTQTKLDTVNAKLKDNKAQQRAITDTTTRIINRGGKTALKGLKTIKPMPKVISGSDYENGKFIVNYKNKN